MFSIILPGRPCLTSPAQITPNQFAFSFPSQPHFSHIVVFLLPGNEFPPDTAAGVHLQLPGEQGFKFLGAIANEKQSAIFRVNLAAIAGAAGDVKFGISVEPIPNIKSQLDQLQAQGEVPEAAATSGAGKPSTKVLAQRIIKNAFNFLASFSGTVGPGGQEVVPLKSFEDWWKKFERKVEMDPSFLERDID